MKFSCQSWKTFKKNSVPSNLILEDVLQTIPQVNTKVLTSLSIGEENFNIIFDKLLEKWHNRETSLPDSEGKRYVNEILFQDLENPLKLCVVADHLDGFRVHYNKYNDDDIFNLFCICGSEKIITNLFLSETLLSRNLLEDDNVLAFALSSGKKELTLTLAKKAFELGRKNPGPLFLYSFSLDDSFFANEVSTIFSGTSPKLKTQEEKFPAEAAKKKESFAMGNIYEKNRNLEAHKILPIPEFSNFFGEANKKQIESFWLAVESERKNQDIRKRVQFYSNQTDKSVFH